MDELQLRDRMGSLSPLKAYGTSLNKYIREYPDVVFTSVEKLLAILCMSINVVRNIQARDLPFLSRSIYKKYYFYSIDEIALVLEMGKNGEFGLIRDRLDENVIMGWFVEYDRNHRAPIIENLRQQDENAAQRDPDNNLLGVIGNVKSDSKELAELKLEIGGLIQEAVFKKKKESGYGNYRKKYLAGKILTNPSKSKRSK